MGDIPETRFAKTDDGAHIAFQVLVAGSGIEFDDRGEYDLKGVPGTWRLFSVAG